MSELLYERRFISLESTAVAVSHWQVDLPAVTPQLGRVHRQPLWEYPTNIVQIPCTYIANHYKMNKSVFVKISTNVDNVR